MAAGLPDYRYLIIIYRFSICKSTDNYLKLQIFSIKNYRKNDNLMISRPQTAGQFNAL